MQTVMNTKVIPSDGQTHLDFANWPRRSAFDFFRAFDIPSFNVCTKIDVTRLKRAVKEVGNGTLSLAYHFIAIRLANEIAPFRYRLDGERVLVHAQVHGSTTVLRADESLGFATLEYQPDFGHFAALGASSLALAGQSKVPLEPSKHGTATIHLTTLPWIHFSSYSNARQWGPNDSIPKIAFGRIDNDGGRCWMPLSVEVHHALMDGLHVGQFIEAFESAVQDPLAILTTTR
jgi:chloramphenicol O-acetyltransferase type A